MDGYLELLDLTKLSEGKAVAVGKPTSVCMPCHKESKAMPWVERYVPAVLCGMSQLLPKK